MAQASQGEKITTELTCWKVEGKAPPLHVRKLLEEVFRKQRVKVKNVALVVGPHTAEAISWIVAMAEGVRVVVLSAASLLQVGGDLPSLRRWLLSEAEGAQDGVVIVLVRPTEWFVSEDPRKSDFPGLLRQVVARCGWRTTGPDGPAFISVLSAPSKAWDHAFDEMIPLEFDLSQATMGYRQLPCHREALTRVTSCSEVKEWLEDILASKPGKALPYAIALVGPSGSGKSTFLAALKTLPMKVLQMSIPALINAGIGDTHLAVRRHFERAQLLQPSCVQKAVFIDDTEVHLFLYDTAGQERFADMAASYYRVGEVCLLCFDMSDVSTFDRTQFWKKKVSDHNPKCLFILVGTKEDLLSEEQKASLEPISRWAEEEGIPYFPTSALRGGEHIRFLFHVVAEKCIRLKREKQLSDSAGLKLQSSIGQPKAGCCQ